MEILLVLLPLLAAVSFAALLAYTLFFKMTFTVDAVHVRVRVFGWTVRKVALADIEYAANDWSYWNEHYNNTLNPQRMVLLRRRTGLFKDFLITPPVAQTFLNELAARGVTLR